MVVVQLIKRQEELLAAREDAKLQLQGAADAAHAEQRRLHSLLDSATTEAAGLRAELSSKDADLAQCKNEKSCLELERLRDKSKLGVMEANVDSMRSEAQKAIEQLNEKHAEAEGLKCSLDLLKAELASETRRADEVASKKEEVEARLRQAQELKACVEQCSRTQAGMKALEAREAAALEQIEDLADQIEQHKQKGDSLQATLATSEAMSKDTSAKLTACTARLEGANQDLKRKQGELEDTRAQVSSAQVWQSPKGL